jgi:serine/threonine protein kinase
LGALFPDIHADALHLLERLLVLNPNQRISVDEALAHPYFANIRQEGDEITATAPFDFEFEKDSDKLTKRKLQELIWEEMRKFHPERQTTTEPPPTLKTDATI